MVLGVISAFAGYALMDGRRLSGLGNQVSSMLSDFHKDSSMANLALAGDKKVYTIVHCGSMHRSL